MCSSLEPVPRGRRRVVAPRLTNDGLALGRARDNAETEMRGEGWCRTLVLAALCAAVSPIPALAQSDAPSVPAPHDGLERARELYKRGVEHVKRSEWAEALAAFEKSAELNQHATTSFNIAACQRALGNYTLAKAAFARALAQDDAGVGQLAGSLREEARALAQQIDALLAHAVIELEPKQALISIDGRPLAAAGKRGQLPVLVAGVEAPGRGRPPPAAKFEVELNPGTHVMTFSRTGFDDAVVHREFRPGSRTKLRIELARLPATLRISSNVEGALVHVNGADVGPVPVDVLRPAGTHEILVFKEGYDPFSATVQVRAGELSAQRATLNRETRSITSRWWFWTAAAAVVVGGVVTTYALTRPDPAPPDYDGGNTGWVVRPAFH
jgi:hypothetical protein